MARRISRREALKYSAATGTMAMGLAGVPRLVAAADPLKVGIVYVSPISEIGWTKQHSLGAEAIADTFGERVSITAIDNVWDPQAGERVFAELASTGHGLVFGTSFSHSTPIQKTAPRFPDVVFEHCSGLKHAENLGTFEAKYYEGTYLAGIAGGHVTESKKLGFIGGFPIPDIVGPGNAMLLGAQSVDPSITCSVIFLNSWFDPAKEKEATAALVAQGCDVICSMTDTATGVQVAEQNGAWSIGYASDMRQFGPTKNLTSFMLDWSSVYVGAARDVLDGTWTSQVRWQGVKEGVVTMSPYNDQLPGDVIDQLTAAAASAPAPVLARALVLVPAPACDERGRPRPGARTSGPRHAAGPRTPARARCPRSRDRPARHDGPRGHLPPGPGPCGPRHVVHRRAMNAAGGGGGRTDGRAGAHSGVR